MHRRTYARWCEKGMSAEQAVLGAMQAWMDRKKASSGASVLSLEARAIHVR